MKYYILVLCITSSFVKCYTTQRPGSDDGNPFLDMASSFLQDALVNQGGGGGGSTGGLGGIASIIGSLIQPDNGSGKADNGAGVLIHGLSTLMSTLNNGNNNGDGGGGGGGFDPSIIGNVIQMFASSGNSGNGDRQKRSNDQEQGGVDWGSMLSLASTFLSNKNQNQPRSNSVNQKENEIGGGGEGLMSLLPMVVQAINSFSGPEGEKVQEKHKGHSLVLPPFLEKIHVMWDHFQQSELAEVLWQKSGIHVVFKGFTGRDGKLDYERLFESLENQSFRRRWIKAATLYLADWANYIADPEVYQRYIATGQIMLNGLLQSQGYPKQTFFDTQRPSETISNLVDHVAKRHLNVKVESVTYVKPAIFYVKDLLALGKARGLLQKFNATEMSDKLTDTLNLEVIEPIMRVYRAYRHSIETPHCDKYLLCEVNSYVGNENLGLAGFKTGIAKFGSMAAAWFISGQTGTPFWTLFGVINDPYNCASRFPVDCSNFHENEAKVKKEYIHNEL